MATCHSQCKMVVKNEAKNTTYGYIIDLHAAKSHAARAAAFLSFQPFVKWSVSTW